MNRWNIRHRIDDNTFREVCASSKSMADAAAQLNLHFNSFKKRALELGCYQTNQAGLGLNKKMPKVPLDEIIIENKHPHFQTFKLKKRLILEGVKSNQCESCGISEWQGKPIEMELHHLDGNRFNHQIQNLLILCPNCHSQTPTFRAKNKKI